jgi:N6-adenosine-specific RNA methylase IME4
MNDSGGGGQGLVLYERARSALAAASRVDEVKDIHDRALAMQAYARQAKDPELIEHATEIRKRAEIRAGEMLAAMKADGRLAEGRPPKNDNGKIGFSTLKAIGVSAVQSSRWQKLAQLSEPEREAAIVSAKREASRSVEMTAAERLAEKRSRREEREIALAAQQRALPDKRFGVILADPEWRFEPWSRETGMDRAADNHYPTSELTEIAARDVARIAADDSVLFLWATAPMLDDALQVMAEWGFEYKTCLIWVKDRVGTGYWVRNAHEHLLIGTRGDPPAPAPGQQWASVIRAPASEHSVKPTIVYEMIEGYFPNLPKIELNARAAREGWSAWGKEAPTI